MRYEDVTCVCDDVTCVYDDVTCVYDDVTLERENEVRVYAVYICMMM